MTVISKRFGPVQALADVTFRVRKGTVHALCGENGAGKSTLMKILAGVHQLDRGEIELDEPTSTLSEAEAKRLFAVVRQLRARGLSIVYISHRLEEVADLADDVSVLRDGKVVHSASASGLTIPAIVQFMVGRELNEFFPA